MGALEMALARAVVRPQTAVDSVILANLVLGAKAVPEFLQGDCTAPALADALVPLLGDTPERRRQIEAFARLDDLMGLPAAPSAKAAEVVLSVIRQAHAARLPDPATADSSSQF
jgi:lipid-A-disaccharide synthase